MSGERLTVFGSRNVSCQKSHLKSAVLGHRKFQGGEQISQQQPEQPLVVLDELWQIHVPDVMQNIQRPHNGLRSVWFPAAAIG